MRRLAVALGTTRQTLSTWIDRWPDFPIVSRGSNGREYQFDASAVVAFLKIKQQAQAETAAQRDQALAQLALPFEVVEPTQQADQPTIKDQIEALRLRRLLREEAEASGRLVDASHVSDLLATGMVAWNRALHQAIRSAGRDHNLPDSLTRALTSNLAATQRAFVAQLEHLIPPDDTDAT